MSGKIFTLCAALLILTAAPANAATKRFLDIQQVTSPGGIHAWLVEDHSAPVISLQFAFAGAGSATDPAGKQGLVQLASNTMDEGAGDTPSPQFQKILADLSIELGYAVGRDDYNGALRTLTRTKDKAFEMLHLSLTAPRFDAEPVQRMKDANFARIRNSLSDPDWMAARILNDISYTGHPYANNSGGTTASIAAITADDLRAYVKNNLTRDRLYVAVSGDISKAELATALDTIFASLPATAKPANVPDIKLQNAGTIALYKRDIPQTIILMAQPGIDRKDPDWHTAQVMNFILGGGGFGSRLTEEIREKRGLTYGVYSGFSLLDHVSTLSIETSTRNEKTAEVLDLIKAALLKMQTTDVTAAELKDAKSYLVGSIPLALTSNAQIASMLRSLQLDNLPDTYLDTISDRINAVTAADIRRVANRLLTPDKPVTILVGMPADVKPTKLIEKLPNAE
ncbi:MAG: peptidase inactive domain protein [Micavibrio sp.]|nr:peptidase inactive domain protein [Micavibrio sp.]